MATDTHAALAAQLAEDAAERFLRYVRIDTQSEEDSESYPSTAKQLDLLRLLADELQQLGLDDVGIDDNGYVTGTLPSTVPHATETIAFFAHVDTAREVSGANVNPRRFRYEAQAGNIGVNIGVAAPMAYFPFSGWKESFFGDLHAQGRHAVEFYTQTKVVVERWHSTWSRKF